MKKAALTVLMFFCLHTAAFAATGEDFAYKGLRIGSSKSEMQQKFGETKVDMDKLADGRWVTYYIFKHTRIGIDDETQAVVDIRSTDKSYDAKNGVKIGATNHKILKEYGQAVKEWIGGRQYYIYRYESQRLMFDVSPGYLKEIRLTSLRE